ASPPTTATPNQNTTKPAPALARRPAVAEEPAWKNVKSRPANRRGAFAAAPVGEPSPAAATAAAAAATNTRLEGIDRHRPCVRAKAVHASRPTALRQLAARAC